MYGECLRCAQEFEPFRFKSIAFTSFGAAIASHHIEFLHTVHPLLVMTYDKAGLLQVKEDCRFRPRLPM